MKFRIFVLLLLFTILPSSLFAASGFEFSLGSGYIFYGSQTVRNRNKALGQDHQVILTTEATGILPLQEHIYLTAGTDVSLDARWSGSNHIYLLDYSGMVGFRIYPGLQGLLFQVDYALGRRTDFISLKNEDSYKESTSWGNGFKLGVDYDFSVHTKGKIAPSVGFAWKNMPRGGYRDNLLMLSLKFGNKRP